MQTHACPAAEQLRHYSEGRLDEWSHTSLDEHLDGCPSCQVEVDTLDERGSSLMDYLRRPAVGLAVEDPLLQRLMTEVLSFGRSSSPAENSECGADAFLTTLSRSGLLSPGDVTSIRSGLSGGEGAAALSRDLVARGLLTEYQARTAQCGEAEGLVLGNYVLLEPLGSGGMGRVFKARHRRLQRIVAVKVLAPDLLRSADARERFRREAEAVARLDSPYIVSALDAGEESGRDFLVMEYVSGLDLAEHVRLRGPLPVTTALSLALQAARGLEQAHAAGIVHRDVKPANLLLDESGTVKVLDLGLARLVEGNGSAPDLTSVGVVMGTAAFMAPEQAVDVRRADARADVYSLGCTLFYLLTGRPPYEGATALETLFAHREQPIPSLGAARRDCPHAVAQLVRQMLAKRPEDRPTSMSAVVARLTELTRGTNRKYLWGQRGRQLAAVAALLAVAVLAWSVVPIGRGQRAGAGQKESSAARAKVPASPGAGSGQPERQRTPVIEMVSLESGEFWRGSPADERDAHEDEKPRHKVKITLAFSLGKYKITQAQYEEVMDKNPSAFSAKGRFRSKVHGVDTSQHPVESLSWLDAVSFCNRLSERHRLPRYYKIDGKTVTVRRDGSGGYRLPTEAEWEYACRAGTRSRWSFGDDSARMGIYGWYAGNSNETTHPVGQKKPNPWGLYDMHGNAAEWCWDRYSATYYRKPHLSDPPGPGEGKTRVYRGGGWNVAAAETRSAARNSLGDTYGVLTIVGLRVARDVEP